MAAPSAAAGETPWLICDNVLLPREGFVLNHERLFRFYRGPRATAAEA
jgi:hypothetical protein